MPETSSSSTSDGADSQQSHEVADASNISDSHSLHFAVKNGQVEVVKHLLRNGAEANAPRLCFQSEADALTPIAMALQGPILTSAGGRRTSDVLKACELLVDEGSSDDDCRLLLEKSAEAGNVELVRKLLKRDVRLAQTPITENVEIVRLFSEAGIEMNVAELQRHAVGKGKLDLMKFLVEENGPALHMNDFGYIAFDVMRGNSADYLPIVRFLITEYGFGVNQIFPAYPGAENYTNLLQRACETFNANAVQLLLEEGADPQCPELPDSALEYFVKSLRSYTLSLGSFSNKYLPIIRLLAKYSEHPEAAMVPTTCYRPKQPEPTKLRLVSERTRPVDPPETATPQSEQVSWIEETTDAFAYQKLQGVNTIRLLELEPSNSTDDPIRCRIHHCSLLENTDFEILTCHWDQSSTTTPMLIDGKTFETPSEMWSALRRVRLNDKPRFLWNEFICINRDEFDERNQQVKLMRDILKTSRQTLAWLGDADQGSYLVFKHLKQCRAENELNWTHYGGQTAESFRKLCSRPWFFRVWSVQELALSKQVTIMCGPDEDKWPAFMKCTSFFPAEDSFHPLDGVDGPSHLRHLEQLRDGKSISLTVLGSRACNASDPRDMIFGISGLFGNLDFPIDYRMDVVEVYRRFTQMVIETSQDINIFHWIGTERSIKNLPSWVPDFSVSNSSATLRRAFGSSSYRMTYPWKVLPTPEFRDNGALVIKGRPIETILEVCDVLPIESSAAPGSEVFSKVFRSWELLASQLTGKRFPNAVSDAFSETITANDLNEPLGEERPAVNDYAAEFIAWYQEHGSGILQEADEKYFSEMKVAQEWIRCIQGSVEYTQVDFSYYAKRLEIACYGRRFFTTDKGSMGLAPPRAQKGDELIFLPGGKYPFVVRGKGNGTHELIGDCFLYDFDVYGLFEDPSIETRDFVLL